MKECTLAGDAVGPGGQCCVSDDKLKRNACLVAGFLCDQIGADLEERGGDERYEGPDAVHTSSCPDSRSNAAPTNLSSFHRGRSALLSMKRSRRGGKTRQVCAKLWHAHLSLLTTAKCYLFAPYKQRVFWMECCERERLINRWTHQT